MNDRCKQCSKREDCSSLKETSTQEEMNLTEYNNTLNLLLQFEQSLIRTINFTLNGRNAGLQWIFFKIMSNKFRAIAKEIEPHLIGRPEADEIDWDAITSIDELSDEFHNDDSDNDESWFKGDIKGV